MRRQHTVRKDLRSIVSVHRVWIVLLLVVVGISIVTRLSYSNLNVNYEQLMQIPYRVGPFSVEHYQKQLEFVPENKPSKLLPTAQLIVEGVVEDKPQLSYQSMLRAVRVLHVYKAANSNKGAHELGTVKEGQVISVYEPLALEGIPSERVFWGSSSYQLGGVPMTKGNKYLLFLNPAPERQAVLHAYMMLDSPFSKLALDDEEVVLPQSPGLVDLSFNQLSNVALVAADETAKQLYLETRAQLIKSFMET
ncbi:hypothetical protein KPC83_00180 [Collinsella sp. zg1085]|uniref:hypothetical protein n=1 Tax=Collinsella sp. zg1085 TaxID=2844380 RepID=UPI001C0CCBAD|nr:hypothetical protein [Collinsella sp. zg1085]QWT17631.1 hypothetical protein KPC83_00180 [Collinsella sp. zg1085]